MKQPGRVLLRRTYFSVRVKAVLLWCVMTLFPALTWAQTPPLKLAMLSYRPEEQMRVQWQPLSDYLSATLNRPIELLILGYDDLEHAVAHHEVDLVMTNSAHYILVRQRHPLSGPLATMVRQENAEHISQFGGVIIASAQADKINTLADLAHKRIAAVTAGSFGGYQTQAMALHEANIPAPEGKQLLFTGMPHDAVVQAVLNGEVDAGFIRTGILEDMQREGRLSPGLVKVVNPQTHVEFPYALSTKLYPEWPIVMMPHVSDALSREVIIALLSLKADSPAAIAAGIQGFSRPADYKDVENLLRTLRLPPFEGMPEFTLMDLWHKYAIWIATIILLFVLLVLAWLALMREFSKVKQAEARLKLAASVFTYAREGIIITDTRGSILDVNEAFSRITGYSRDEALGRNPRFLSSGRQSASFYEAMWKSLVEKGHWYGELWNRRKTGEVYAQMTTISAVWDESDQIQHYVGLQSDITTIKQHQKQLEHIAHYDVLTGLPNRVLLADRLQQAMLQVERQRTSLAVVFIDLDGFKAVNDQHGHEEGDQLLISLATQMKRALRKGDTLARIGGDEFVGILTDLRQLGDCEPLLMRLLRAASKPMSINDELLHVSASIGVTIYPADAVEAEQLIRHADMAMYQAKQSGKNRFHYFDVEKDRMVKSYRDSQQRIEQALKNNEFVLFYQPKVNMLTGQILGAEALIRWQHPEKGLLPPGAFLPLIENHPLSVDIDQWVLEQALTQLQIWTEQGQSLVVSVNICARMLQQVEFVDDLKQRLMRYPQVAPQSLELEVLETSALEDMAHVSRVIRLCQDLGVNFALDDFGTGYSSLTYLRHLPAQLIKIDQSFVRDMLIDPDDLAIVGGVVGLAAAFHRDVIAEGVETVAHGELLLLMGCELAQGYGIARPMPPEQFMAWRKTWRPDPLWQAWKASDNASMDLALLLAEVEHRAWIVHLEAFVAGDKDAPPPMDVHRCNFGKWYDTKGLRYTKQNPDFELVEHLHHQVHALGNEILARHEQGREVETQLVELNQLKDRLISQLRGLMKKPGQQNLALDDVSK